jgi:hypothetical protein
MLLGGGKAAATLVHHGLLQLFPTTELEELLSNTGLI